MPRQEIQVEVDDLDWRDRCEHWRNYQPVTRGARKKFKYREPLILCGHGIRLRVDHNTLLIRNGFTHYPQKAEEIRFFPGDANLPDRIIILDGSGGISFQALNWMSDQDIDFIQLDWRGNSKNIGSGSLFSARPNIVAAQRAAKLGNKSPKIAAWLISEKFLSKLRMLENVLPNSIAKQKAVGEIQRSLLDLKKPVILNSIPKIFGVEGRAAQVYFQAWQGLKLNWTPSRIPIPASWHAIGARTMTWRKSIQNARHPINAMLNYGYAMAASQVRAKVMAVGLDPSIGIMHGNRHNKMPLVSDLMESMRPVVDQQILTFALAQMFHPGDFTINRHGGCRLNPQLAKTVASRLATMSADQAVNSFLRQL